MALGALTKKTNANAHSSAEDSLAARKPRDRRVGRSKKVSKNWLISRRFKSASSSIPNTCKPEDERSRQAAGEMPP